MTHPPPPPPPPPPPRPTPAETLFSSSVPGSFDGTWPEIELCSVLLCQPVLSSILGYGISLLGRPTALDSAATEFRSRQHLPRDHPVLVQGPARPLQGYLTHKKQSPPRTLQ